MAPPGGRASEAGDDAADAIADWRLRPASGRRRRRRRSAASAGEALQLSARELRIVLTVLFILFVTGEAWQVFGRLGGVRYAALILLFGVLAGLLGALGRILVVGLAVSGGFLAFGVLMVGETLTREWAALGEGDEAGLKIYDLGVGGLVASEPLLRLVGVLGGFAALLFAVEVLADPEVRAEMTDDLLNDWNAALAAWERSLDSA